MNNKNTAELRFSSFDGGGPEYKVLIDDESILTAELTREYYSPNHAEQCGSGYDVNIVFTAHSPGKTTVKIECRSPIAENFDSIYTAEVSEELTLTLTEVSTEDIHNI